MLVDLYSTRFDKLVHVAERVLRDRGLAEACVQDAFLRFHLQDAEPRKGCEAAYLRSMVRNGAISTMRREQRGREITNSFRIDVGPSAEAVALSWVAAGELKAQVNQLAPQQSAVVAHRLSGRSVAETASVMQVSSGTVKTHRHRAAAAMRSSTNAPVAA